MTGENEFERLLKDGWGQSAQQDPSRLAMRDVADIAYACKLWFESYRLAATAADVVAMARLVREREAAVGAADKFEG